MIRSSLPSLQYERPRPDSRRGAASPRLPSLMLCIHNISPVVGVERHRGAARAGGGEQAAVHHQRRALKLELGPRPEVLGLEAEGELQLAEVARVDLIERRVARAREVGAVGRPFADLRRPLPAHRHGGHAHQQRNHTEFDHRAAGSVHSGKVYSRHSGLACPRSLGECGGLGTWGTIRCEFGMLSLAGSSLFWPQPRRRRRPPRLR